MEDIMNEVWRNIFKTYIESYDAIETLKRNCILDEDNEDGVKLKMCLLNEIIETFKSEAED